MPLLPGALLPTMNPTEATSAIIIARCRHLHAVIAEAKDELAQLEAVLRHRALAMPHEPLTDGYREGRRAWLRDGDQSVSVIFESDVLKASFDAHSPFAKSVRSMLAHDQFEALFKTKETIERRQSDGHKFRLAANDALGQDLAAKLVDVLKDRDKNGIVKSKSVLEWKP